MECSKCGCPLTEGVSLFCPECGTPVENKKNIPPLAFKIVMAVVVILSLGWIALPVLRAGGNQITSLSVLDILIGKSNFDGMKIPAIPYLAPIFLIAPAICLFFIFKKNTTLHSIYANIGVFQIYHAIIISCIWAVLIIAGAYFNNIYAYGYGIVVHLCMTLLSAFLAISFSASQKSALDNSRSVTWITTAAKYNIVVMIVQAVVLLAGVTMFGFLSTMLLFSIMSVLSLVSGFMAYLKIINKDFTQWMLLSIHTIITALTQLALLFSADNFVSGFTGEADFLDISGFLSPYIGTICIGALVFSLIYNLAFTVWSYKQLKRKKFYR